MKEGGASPDGFWAKPSLIGSVRDSEQVQEKALSPSPFPLPPDLCLAFFCFVNPWLLICISIHVLFMAFWRKISRDHLAVVCRHKRYSPCVCVCVDEGAISKLLLRHRLTLMQPKEMNDLCDCHTEGAEQPWLHRTLFFQFSDSL